MPKDFDSKKTIASQLDPVAISKKVGFKDTTPSSLPATDRGMFLAQNILRAFPAFTVELLTDYLKFFKGDIFLRPGGINLRTNEGAAAVNEAIGVLKK